MTARKNIVKLKFPVIIIVGVGARGVVALDDVLALIHVQDLGKIKNKKVAAVAMKMTSPELKLLDWSFQRKMLSDGENHDYSTLSFHIDRT